MRPIIPRRRLIRIVHICKEKKEKKQTWNDLINDILERGTEKPPNEVGTHSCVEPRIVPAADRTPEDRACYSSRKSCCAAAADLPVRRDTLQKTELSTIG